MQIYALREPLTGRRRILRAGALLCLASSLSFASLSPCGTTTYSMGNSGSTALVSPGGAAAGCEQVDNQFTNFAYSANANGPAGSAIPVSFTGSTVAGPIDILFGSTLSSNKVWPATTTPGTQSTMTYNLSVDQSASGFTAPTEADISTLILSTPAIHVSNATTTAFVTEYFCLNGMLSGCSNYGYIQYEDVGTSGGVATAVICYNGSSTCIPGAPTTLASVTTAIALSLPSGITNIQIQDIVLITNTTGSDYLGQFQNGFDESSFIPSPEPATFGLMGLALAGLGALRYRRKY